MPDSLSIFHDPVKLADFIVEPLKSYLENKDQLPLPTPDEVKQWSISEPELDRCAKEFFLMAAVGAAVTVMRNKPFEFYSTFIHALAGRVSALMFGHYGVTSSDELTKVIEKYMDYLESDMVEFSYMYTNRVFRGNQNQVAIIAAGLWQRAFDLMMATMNASKQFFTGCMADELLQKRATR